MQLAVPHMEDASKLKLGVQTTGSAVHGAGLDWLWAERQLSSMPEPYHLSKSLQWPHMLMLLPYCSAGEGRMPKVSGAGNDRVYRLGKLRQAGQATERTGCFLSMQNLKQP